MEILATTKAIKSIMNTYGFKFNKKLGQNFLIDDGVLIEIAENSGIDDSYGVIEIGPGIGALTQYLARSAKKVVAVELDDRLIPILGQTLVEYDNVKIVHNDILKVDIRKLIQDEFEGLKVAVVANLPYYITTPIIMELLENKYPIESIVVMVQKEVALRMASAPGSKDYGALSVAVQYHTKPETLFTVYASSFMPPPQIDSAVIKLTMLDKPPVDIKSEKMFFKVVKAAFAQRRKTLLNALSNSGIFNISKDEIKNMITECGHNENVRGEQLSLQDFATIANRQIK